jgi:protoporphyrinogen IX oxidase
MLLALSLHIAFLSVWSAALLALPLLFARQATAPDADERARLAMMQRWLYSNVMTPSGLLTVAFGIWLIFERGFDGGWLPVKLALVAGMGLFHAYCGVLMIALKHGTPHRPAFYRLLPLAPASLVAAVVTLVTGKPF